MSTTLFASNSLRTYMSEFDKEAEREKLREQLEAEEEDREATQQMSELLLSGATMTGKHCNDCASPIFRRNGQEFCPTCNQATGEVDRAQTDQAQASRAQADRSAAQQPTDQPTTEPRSSEDATVASTGQTAPAQGPADATAQPTSAGVPQRTPDESQRSASPTAGAGEIAVPEGDGDLAAARNALARKLTRLAAQAEATDDVGRARELLAATREAAEALAAMDRVDQGNR